MKFPRYGKMIYIPNHQPDKFSQFLLLFNGKAVFTPEPKFWAHSPASLVVTANYCVLTYIVGHKYMNHNLKKIVTTIQGTLYI